MEFYNFLRKEAKDFDNNIFLVGGFSGVANALLIFVFTTAAGKIGGGGSNILYPALAMLCLVAYWASKRYLLKRTTIIVEGVVHRIRLRIADNIRMADLGSFEKIGGAPLYNAISTHTLNISQAATAIINSTTSLIMLILAFLFIYFLSPTAFYIVATTLCLLVILFSSNRKALLAKMDEVSSKDNDFVEGFNDLLMGFKELKMSSAKSEDFMQHCLKSQAESTQRLKIEAGTIINSSTIIAQCSLYILLAAVLFLLTVIQPAEAAKIIPVVAIVVFIFGPIGEVISVYPFLTRAIASINEIYRVEALLKEIHEPGASEEAVPFISPGDFSRVRCDNLSFDYRDKAGASSFSLNPFHFQIQRGEIVFIVGGNGSGKSTFLKVFCGLYPAKTGSILVNDRTVTPGNIVGYRNLICPIFSDFHLFDRLYGVSGLDEQRVQDLLEFVHLSQHTQIVRGRISNRNLSSGQRKRLALVVATLEDKPFYVFDEWAAEQDPGFRKTFYEEYLVSLRQAGKTILAVTHDEKYFQVADRIVKMEYGEFKA